MLVYRRVYTYIHTIYSPDIFHRIWLEVKIWDLDALALHCSVPTGEETATWHFFSGRERPGNIFWQVTSQKMSWNPWWFNLQKTSRKPENLQVFAGQSAVLSTFINDFGSLNHHSSPPRSPPWLSTQVAGRHCWSMPSTSWTRPEEIAARITSGPIPNIKHALRHHVFLGISWIFPFWGHRMGVVLFRGWVYGLPQIDAKVREFWVDEACYRHGIVDHSSWWTSHDRWGIVYEP